MIYKFKSKACGDVIMLGVHGDELMRVIGRDPAAQGIIEPEAMPVALQRMRAACEQAERAPDARPDGEAPDDGDAERRGVGLRQRLWPMTMMLERSLAEGVPVVWGV